MSLEEGRRVLLGRVGSGRALYKRVQAQAFVNFMSSRSSPPVINWT